MKILILNCPLSIKLSFFASNFLLANDFWGFENDGLKQNEKPLDMPSKKQE